MASEQLRVEQGIRKALTQARNLFAVIPAYANGIGAEVLPDCSIEPNALPLPPPDLTTIVRRCRQASIVIVLNRLLIELVRGQRYLSG